MTRDYFGAAIRSVQFGPRRELTVQLEIRPKQNTATDGTSSQRATVRFGGISNYEEVLKFFDDVNLSESLHCMKDAPGSKPAQRMVDLEWDRTERRVRILASNVKEY